MGTVSDLCSGAEKGGREAFLGQNKLNKLLHVTNLQNQSHPMSPKLFPLPLLPTSAFFEGNLWGGSEQFAHFESAHEGLHCLLTYSSLAQHHLKYQDKTLKIVGSFSSASSLF